MFHKFCRETRLVINDIKCRSAAFSRSTPNSPFRQARRHTSTLTPETGIQKPSTLERLGPLFFSIPICFTAGLAVWQYNRMKWKEEMIEQRREIFKLPIQSFNTARFSDEERKALQYHRVQFEGRFDHSKDMLVGPRPLSGEGYGYLLISPLHLADGSVVLVNRGWIPTAIATKPSALEALQTTGDVTVKGVVRIPEQPSGLVPPNEPSNNRWFSLKAKQMGRHVGSPSTPLLIDVVGGPRNVTYPIGRDPDELLSMYLMPGTHLQYAATWGTLSICLTGLTYFRFFRKKPPLRRQG